MADQKVSVEESFRESLKDLVAIAQGLSSLCQNLEEMVGVVELALENDTQLRMLMKVISNKK